MKFISIIFTLSFLSCPTFSQSFDNIFISIDELQMDLNNPNLVILQTDNPDNFTKGHIPGAILFRTEQFAVTRDSLYYELPDVDYFREQLMNCGIDNSSRIIICSGWDTFAHAFRLFITLNYYGLEYQARILDGGVRTWNASNLPITTDSTILQFDKRSSPKLNPDPDILVDKDWIRENMNDTLVTIIDARRDIYYSGSEKGRYIRSGHIRNAKNLTWTTLVDENFKLLDKKELSRMFANTGLNEDHTLITYCHVALRASVIFTVGKALGYRVRLYDGSYNEWDGLDPEKYPSISE